MLDLFGRGYVIEHCISSLSIKRKDEQYKYYLTDCLKNINKIIATQYSGEYINERFYNLVKDEIEKEEKTGDEIVKEVMKKACLNVKGGAIDDTV